MKLNLLVVILLFASFFLNAQKDYVITIDGEDYDIELDGNRAINLNGKSVNIGLKQKDTLLLDESYFQLKYVKQHKVSRVAIEAGIEQIMIITAGGSGIILQKYNSFNPTMLENMMLNEVTKESVSYGYSLKREDYDKTLASGETIKVLRAVLEYKGETETYEIASHGKKDEGIIVMTMDMNMTTKDGGKELIQLMWDTLSINK